MKKILLIVAVLTIQQGSLYCVSQWAGKDEYASLISIPRDQRTPEQQERLMQLGKPQTQVERTPQMMNISTGDPNNPLIRHTFRP